LLFSVRFRYWPKTQEQFGVLRFISHLSFENCEILFCNLYVLLCFVTLLYRNLGVSSRSVTQMRNVSTRVDIDTTCGTKSK